MFLIFLSLLFGNLAIVTGDTPLDSDSAAHMERLYKWLADLGGYVNIGILIFFAAFHDMSFPINSLLERVEVRQTSYGGHGVFLKPCSHCAMNGWLFPAWRSKPIPQSEREESLRKEEEEEEEEEEESMEASEDACDSGKKSVDEALVALHYDAALGVDPKLASIPFAAIFYFFSPHLSPSTQAVLTGMLAMTSDDRNKQGNDDDDANYDPLSDNNVGSDNEKDVISVSEQDRLNVAALALELRNATSFFRPYFETIAYDADVRSSVRFSEEERKILDRLNQTYLYNHHHYLKVRFFMTN
jgi:hypothetical protein